MKRFKLEAAPMAGYTDLAFRRVINKCGIKVTYTEMISATALFYKSKKTLELLRHDKNTVVQLFGKVPEHFVYAIKSGHLSGFNEININMGCPAPKIIKNGEGCALMQKPDLARKIITACVCASDKPVSVKFRLGLKQANGKDTAVKFARMCEAAGAKKLIIHGRYGEQGYRGTADWEAVAEVVRAVNIPVIANGDIKDTETAVECLQTTNAAGVMSGRGLLGSPWAFLNKAINEKKIKKIILYHINQAVKCGGEDAFLEMKKHLLFYCGNLNGGKEMKKKVAIAENFEEIKAIMDLR